MSKVSFDEPASPYRIVVRPRSDAPDILECFFLINGKTRHSCYGSPANTQEIENFALGYCGQRLKVERVEAGASIA